MAVRTTHSFADLPDDTFRKIVDDDLRNRASAEDSKALRSKENVDRWFSMLLQMTKSVEGQLAARKADWANERLTKEADIERLLSGDVGALTDEEMTMSVEDREARANQWRGELHTKRVAYNKWRAGIIRFKTGLDEYLAEARHLRDRHHGEFVYRQMNTDLATRVRLLEEGIKRHRDHLLADDLNDDEHEEADEQLWSLIL